MLDANGYEIPDNTPVEIPTRLRLPQTRAAQIQSFIRHELSMRAQAEGQESFEEANDLEVEEGVDFGYTAYERSAEYGVADLVVAAEYQESQRARAAAPPEQQPPAPSPALTPDAGAAK